MRRFFIRSGVWLVLGVAVLVWELLGVKNICRWLGIKPDHKSLSQIEWDAPLPIRAVVIVLLCDVIVHFTFRTPLIPGIG